MKEVQNDRVERTRVKAAIRASKTGDRVHVADVDALVREIDRLNALVDQLRKPSRVRKQG